MADDEKEKSENNKTDPTVQTSYTFESSMHANGSIINKFENNSSNFPPQQKYKETERE